MEVIHKTFTDASFPNGDLDSNHWVIVDFSNLAYLSLFAVCGSPDSLTEDYKEHFSVFVDKIKTNLKWISNQSSCVVFAKDHFPRHKLEIYPQYKQQRKELKTNPKKGLIEALHEDVGGKFVFYTAEVKDQEADDVIASLVAQNLNKEVVVVTSDKDLWQLLQYKNCKMFCPLKRRYITAFDIKEKFGINSPKNIVICKSLWGDRSDNIENAFKRSQKAVLPLLNSKEFDTIEEFIFDFENVLSSHSKTTRDNYHMAKEHILRNCKLVKLNMGLNVCFKKYE